eukprot:COSAG06_NODE_53053_length_302_cov_0.768473_1_plen_54_part_10
MNVEPTAQQATAMVTAKRRAISSSRRPEEAGVPAQHSRWYVRQGTGPVRDRAQL